MISIILKMVYVRPVFSSIVQSIELAKKREISY